MRWMRRGWKMVPVVAAAVVGVSCGGDDATAPSGGANVQFGFGDIDLQAGRDTVLLISNTGGSAIILTTADIRRYVRRLIDSELPHVAVLSYQELSPELQIQPAGRIGIGVQSGETS